MTWSLPDPASTDDFGAGGNVTSLFASGGNAEALAFLGFLPRPAEFLCGGLEDGPETRVGQVAEAELERIEIGGAGQFVHVTFPGEVIGGGGESPIRAAAKDKRDGMILDELVGDVVGSVDTG